MNESCVSCYSTMKQLNANIAFFGGTLAIAAMVMAFVVMASA